MLLTCGAYGHVVRWIPPLLIDESQVNESLALFAAALEETT